MSVSRALPCCISAAAMNGLSVDPGSYGSVSAVLAVLRGSARWLAMARTSPSAGFMTTTSPPSAPIVATASASARSAISCSSWLIVRTTLRPCTGGVPGVDGDANRRPRASFITVAVPGVPRSSESSASSMPSTARPSASTRPTMRRVPSLKA